LAQRFDLSASISAWRCRNGTHFLEETVAIHLVELLKYNFSEAELATATSSDRWLYWLLHSHEYTSEELFMLFPELEMQQATKSLNEINLITKDEQMYDL